MQLDEELREKGRSGEKIELLEDFRISLVPNVESDYEQLQLQRLMLEDENSE